MFGFRKSFLYNIFSKSFFFLLQTFLLTFLYYYIICLFTMSICKCCTNELVDNKHNIRFNEPIHFYGDAIGVGEYTIEIR